MMHFNFGQPLASRQAMPYVPCPMSYVLCPMSYNSCGIQCVELTHAVPAAARHTSTAAESVYSILYTKCATNPNTPAVVLCSM